MALGMDLLQHAIELLSLSASDQFEHMQVEDGRGYAAERIDAGLEDLRLGRTLPAEAIYAMLQVASGKPNCPGTM
jgi:hypothetical protein